MAARPWVKPEDLKMYTDYEDVGQRSDEKIKIDISRAESYVMHHTGQAFENGVLPENIRIAVLLLAEYYAHLNYRASTGTIQSETFDDYSYVTEIREIEFEDLNIRDLLMPYLGTAP